MIIGKLHGENDEIHFLPEALQKILNLIKNCNFKELKNGKYELYGNKIFLVINDYETKKPENKKAEQHKTYVDVQYIISGKELIGVGYQNQNNEIVDNYNHEKDRTSYGKVEGEIYVSLREGMYVILFPSDIHRPELDFEGRQKVRKAVIKVDKEILFKVKDDIKGIKEGIKDISIGLFHKV